MDKESVDMDKDLTPLQRHAAFFDRNGDGYITLSETYEGCRALGYGRLLSSFLAVSINAGLGWKTTRFPYPTLRIRLDRIHRGKHGSDTNAYNYQGQFDAQEFERIFKLYDRDGDDAFDFREMWNRARGQRDIYDVVGQVVSLFEFALTYAIAGEDGKLSKEALRAIYDGSLFYEVEAKRRGRVTRRR